MTFYLIAGERNDTGATEYWNDCDGWVDYKAAYTGEDAHLWYDENLLGLDDDHHNIRIEAYVAETKYVEYQP
jgi:hypothetical protein